MSTPNIDRISEFRRKLRDLVLEYGVEIEVDTSYYGDIEGVDFCVDGKRAVSTDNGCWDFDDNGSKSIEAIRREYLAPEPILKG